MLKAHQEFMFVTGCSRSGTSVMSNLLREHPAIGLGRERFADHYFHEADFPQSLFEKERFCKIIRPSDSHHRELEPYYGDLYCRFESCRYIGDKIPPIALDYSKLLRNFARPRIVFMLRNILDVADSFNLRVRKARASGRTDGWPWGRDSSEAIAEWNRSLKQTLKVAERIQLHTVVYERLFEDDSEIKSLFGFLDLPLTDAVVAAHRDLMAEHRELDQARRLSLSSLEKFEIMKRASFGAYRQMLDMAGRQGEVRTGSKNLTI